MAHLALRRSFFERIETLSVVYLAVMYAVLSIALGVEWGRAISRMAPGADEYVTPSAAEHQPSGALQ